MSGPERRKHTRYRIDLKATVSVGERWVKAIIPDISAGGYQMQLDEEITVPPRSVLRLERRGEACSARGITRWCRGRNIGIEFEQLDAAFQRLFDDLSTLRPAFHRTLFAQLLDVEVSFD